MKLTFVVFTPIFFALFLMSCEKEEIITESPITEPPRLTAFSFNFPVVAIGTISQTDNEISIEVPSSTDLSKVVSKINLSEETTITPDPRVAMDLSDGYQSFAIKKGDQVVNYILRITKIPYQYKVSATKIECVKCFQESDGKAEFSSSAYLNTNEEPDYINFNLNKTGVPVSGTGYYSNKSHIFSFKDIGTNDHINFEATLVERNNTNNEDFGEVKKTIKLKDLPDDGEITLSFGRKVGTDQEQVVRLYFRVTKLN